MPEDSGLLPFLELDGNQLAICRFLTRYTKEYSNKFKSFIENLSPVKSKLNIVYYVQNTCLYALGNK